MRAAALRTPWRASPLGFDPVRYTTNARSTPLDRLHATPDALPFQSSRLFSSSRVATSRVPCRPYASRGRAPLLVPRYRYSSGPAAQGPGAGQSQGRGNKKALKYAIVGGVLGVGVIVYWDEVQHLYRAAARTGRVVGALAVCINE